MVSEAKITIKADTEAVKQSYAEAQLIMNKVDKQRRQMIREVTRDVTRATMLFGSVRTMSVDILRLSGIVLDAHSMAIIQSVASVVENFTRMAVLYAQAGAITGQVALLAISGTLGVATTIYALQTYGQTNELKQEIMTKLTTAERVSSMSSMFAGGF